MVWRRAVADGVAGSCVCGGSARILAEFSRLDLRRTHSVRRRSIFLEREVCSGPRCACFGSCRRSSWALLLVNQGIGCSSISFLRRTSQDCSRGCVAVRFGRARTSRPAVATAHQAPSKEKIVWARWTSCCCWCGGCSLYLFFVVPWQYVIPNEGAYNSSYDVLAVIQDTVTLLVLGILAYRASAGWRHFCTAFFLVELLRCSSAFVLNRAIELNQYYAGSWYDLPYLLCVALFTGVAVIGKGLQATRERQKMN